MKICILHGYLLEGSGSNLWTRYIVRSSCRNGETVHLVCQENHPDRYDFIAEVTAYAPGGKKEKLLSRDVPYDGCCVMHKPQLGDTLPVYVRDRYEEFPNPTPMVELDDKTIEGYLDINVEVVKRVIGEYGITAILANHAVLMPTVAQRAGEAEGIPFTIMPHGSAIEYAVKKDERFLGFATDAFENAKKIFAIGDEIRGRIKNVFPSIR